MIDLVHAVQDRGEVVRAQIKLDQAEAGLVAQPHEVSFLVDAWIVGVERVHSDDLVPFAEEPLRQVRPDEPGRRR